MAELQKSQKEMENYVYDFLMKIPGLSPSVQYINYKMDNIKIIGKIPDESIDSIYNLFAKDVFFEPKNDMELMFMGDYYYYKKDYSSMKKYYKKAIDMGNSISMVRIADYYNKIRDYKNMLKYYRLAIIKCNSIAMKHFYMWYSNKYYKGKLRYGYEFESGQDPHEFFMEIFSEPIKNNDSNALLCVSKYMKFFNNPEFEKYYNLAFKNRNEKSNEDLLLFSIEIKKYDGLLDILCSLNHNSDEENDKLIRYLKISECKSHFLMHQEKYLQLIEKIDKKHINKLDKETQIIWKLLKEKIDLLEIHFNYSPDSVGFDEAKKDFFKKVANQQ